MELLRNSFILRLEIYADFEIGFHDNIMNRLFSFLLENRKDKCGINRCNVFLYDSMALASIVPFPSIYIQ